MDSEPKLNDLRLRIRQVDRFRWAGVLDEYKRNYSGGDSWKYKWDAAIPNRKENYGWRYGWFRWWVMMWLKHDIRRINKIRRREARRKFYLSKDHEIKEVSSSQ